MSAAAPCPYLDGRRLVDLLGPAEALGAVRGFFAANPRGGVEVPPRIHLRVPGPDTVGLYMPAATARHVGVKIVHLMPGRFPSVEAEVFLYDAGTGRLLFWGDGKPMTARRTAAVSTAASLRLLPRCRTVVLFGAGVQAAAHAEAFAAAYPALEGIRAVTRSPQSLARLRDAVSPTVRERLLPGDALERHLGEADCVIATTPAPQPLFDWDALAPAAHVVGIGSATPHMNELPPRAFLEGSVWLDTSNALEEAGDCRAAMQRGWDPASVRGDLFDLLGGEPPPRPPGRTVFKSVGHAAQDLAILVRLWERLQAGD